MSWAVRLSTHAQGRGYRSTAHIGFSWLRTESSRAPAPPDLRLSVAVVATPACRMSTIPSAPRPRLLLPRVCERRAVPPSLSTLSSSPPLLACRGDDASLYTVRRRLRFISLLLWEQQRPQATQPERTAVAISRRTKNATATTKPMLRRMAAIARTPWQGDGCTRNIASEPVLFV